MIDENENNKVMVLIESFSFLDGYYFIGNDLKKNELENDLLNLEGLINYFKFINEIEILKMLNERKNELEIWINSF